MAKAIVVENGENVRITKDVSLVIEKNTVTIEFKNDEMIKSSFHQEPIGNLNIVQIAQGDAWTKAEYKLPKDIKFRVFDVLVFLPVNDEILWGDVMSKKLVSSAKLAYAKDKSGLNFQDALSCLRCYQDIGGKWNKDRNKFEFKDGSVYKFK